MTPCYQVNNHQRRLTCSSDSVCSPGYSADLRGKEQNPVCNIAVSERCILTAEVIASVSGFNILLWWVRAVPPVVLPHTAFTPRRVSAWQSRCCGRMLPLRLHHPTHYVTGGWWWWWYTPVSSYIRRQDIICRTTREKGAAQRCTAACRGHTMIVTPTNCWKITSIRGEGITQILCLVTAQRRNTL